MISSFPPPPAWEAPAEVAGAPAWIATTDFVAWLLDPFAEERCAMWSEEEIAQFRSMAARLELDPRNLLGPIASESNCSPAAHNPGGAVGLIQFEPSTLRDLGWNAGTDAFAQLTVSEQLPYVERYFQARIGALRAAHGTMGAIYTAMFLPALISHAVDQTYVLCGQHGPLAWAYAANKSFDVDRKGLVTVGDLVGSAERALARPGPSAILSAIEDAQEAEEKAAAGALASLAAIPPDVT